MATNLEIPKLLHITTVPDSLYFFTGQVGYMKTREFEVQALASPGELLAKFASQEDIIVHSVEMPRRITPIQDLRAIFRLWQCISQIQPQIVHAHTPKGGLLGMIGAWLARVPVRVYHIHGLPLMTAKGYKRLLLWWSEKVSCLLANQVFCVSHSVLEVVLSEGLCPTAKVKVLLRGSINGVDAINRFNKANVSETNRQEICSQYGIPNHALVMGFVGRIVRDKGIAELVSAWKILCQEFPELHLLVVGYFEPQDSVTPEVEYFLKNDSRIHLTGMAWNTPQLYAAMDVLILPTYREGFPVVPLEAAAMQLPVVATRIPGCIDAVQDGVTGILVPPRNVEALAEAIRMYLKNPELRSQHGNAGRDRVLNYFRQEAIWDAFYQEYRRLLQEKKGYIFHVRRLMFLSLIGITSLCIAVIPSSKSSNKILPLDWGIYSKYKDKDVYIDNWKLNLNRVDNSVTSGDNIVVNDITYLEKYNDNKSYSISQKFKANVFDVVKDFGATGNGISDDTNTIQKAINTVYSQGGGVIVFPPGIYLVTSVKLKENITYQGYGATIKRPPNQGKWIRTFTTEYQGNVNSNPLIIKGFTFDGNSQNQGAYKNYELEQAHLIFLFGNPDSPGKLQAFIEDCTFTNGVADAISVYTNVDVTVTNVEATNVFRGGFVLTGGNSSANVSNLTTKGNIDPTGIDIEVDGKGYGGTLKVNVLLNNINLINGDFDVAVSDGSIVLGNDIISSDAPFYIFSLGSTLKFTNSKFKVGATDGYENRIIFPHNLIFENCEFYVTRKETGKPYSFFNAADIWWQQSNYPIQKNQVLLFKDVQFKVDNNIQPNDITYAIYSRQDALSNNNQLVLQGVSIAEQFTQKLVKEE